MRWMFYEFVDESEWEGLTPQNGEMETDYACPHWLEELHRVETKDRHCEYVEWVSAHHSESWYLWSARDLSFDEHPLYNRFAVDVTTRPPERRDYQYWGRFTDYDSVTSPRR